MALEVPWFLVADDPVPESVQFWVIPLPPDPPVTVASLAALRLTGVDAKAFWGTPSFPDPATVVWRTVEVTFTGPADEELYPFDWSCIAIVDTDPGGGVLGIFTLPQSLDLEVSEDRVVVDLILECCRFG